MMRGFMLMLAGLVVSGSVFAADRPNIIVIYADDLGYGDVGCNGGTQVKTPNIDRLAAQGLRFTDAHAPAATCTPSRYSLLTGEYAWRRRGTGILPGDASLIIPVGKPTLPSMLKQAGYTTGAVGKWHLGLGEGKVDWNTDIKPGPLEIGFDYSFLLPATGDRTPCVYVENHRVVNLDPKDPIQVSYGTKVGDEPTGKEHPELLKMKLSHGHDNTIVNGISRIGFMSGGKAARWKDEEIADRITARAVSYIEKNKAGPFFLYFATHDVHVPRVPHPRFAGRSATGVRGDVIAELDWSVGQIMETLERLKIAENTILIFTSDNGPVVDDGYADGAVEYLGKHKPAGPYRGTKYTPYEGGTRVPMILRWPGKVKAGSTSDALVCQIDFMASFAGLTEQELKPEAGPDSLNTLPAFLGQSEKGREVLVEQGQRLAIRKGNWKLIVPGPAAAERRNPNANPANGELYNLSEDVAEAENVAGKNREKVNELAGLLKEIREGGRSRR